ncbi:MAG TPA: MFS transporter [Solirubrobacterales bacterium]|nr:MFS transporter [Solirubrobacterales bacterium]
MLAAYGLLAATTQLLWLTFAPITTQAAGALHVDVGTAGDLAVIFPLVYIVLALPFGRLLDAHFRSALGAGAALTGLGAVVRALDPASFGFQLAGQAVIAVAQPLVLNSITKIAAANFPERERATAISIGTVALFVGILAAVLSGGPLFAVGGLRLVLWSQGAVALAVMALMLTALSLLGAGTEEAAAAVSVRSLLADRLLWRLAILVFLGMGIYNAVATWLEAILDHFGRGSTAGDLIAIMTLGGVAGAAVLPSLAAARDRRRAFLLLALAATAAAYPLLALRQDLAWAATVLFLDGFLLMACLPVVLDWSDVHTSGRRQGEATGFLLLAGNLGGVVLALAVQLLLGSPYAALISIAACALIGLPAALGLPAAIRGASARTSAPAPAESSST